jgi:L-lactate dehydrogenase complex protein LldG
VTDSEARREILARVRRTCAGRSPEDIARERAQLASGPPPILESDDAATTFLTRVLANGASAGLAADRSAVVAAIAQFLREHFHSNRLVVAHEPRLAALPWREAGVLPRFGGARDGDEAALSYAALGVAETGAVVTYTGRANPAAHHLLAVAHIALVDVADLYLTLEQSWERIRADMAQAGRPRGINFIAGPSSTADVEAQLVRGAHGPRALHVMLVGEVPPQTLETARTLAGGPDYSGI